MNFASLHEHFYVRKHDLFWGNHFKESGVIALSKVLTETKLVILDLHGKTLVRLFFYLQIYMVYFLLVDFT